MIRLFYLALLGVAALCVAAKKHGRLMEGLWLFLSIALFFFGSHRITGSLLMAIHAELFGIGAALCALLRLTENLMKQFNHLKGEQKWD